MPKTTDRLGAGEAGGTGAVAPRKAKRLTALVDALNERRVLHIRDAARLLAVSEMTVRRDVAENPQNFIFLGGHIMPATELEGAAPYDLSRAADQHAAAKKAACRRAVRLLRPGDIVFIDCGTTLTHLVDLIPDDMPLTVVCYALNIAEKLMRKPNVELILLGGLYHPASAAFTGPTGLESLNAIGLTIAFISAAGIEPSRGATCEYFHEVPIKQRAVELAQRSYLVADSSKFGRTKQAFIAPLDIFDAVFTEEGEDKKTRKARPTNTRN